MLKPTFELELAGAFIDDMVPFFGVLPTAARAWTLARELGDSFGPSLEQIAWSRLWSLGRQLHYALDGWREFDMLSRVQVFDDRTKLLIEAIDRFFRLFDAEGTPVEVYEAALAEFKAATKDVH